MNEDPRRWRDEGAYLPPALRHLVRDAEEPPPLPPRVRIETRERLRAAVTAAPAPTRWMMPAVALLTGVAATLVLVQWIGGQEPSADTEQLVQEPPMAVHAPPGERSQGDGVPGQEPAPPDRPPAPAAPGPLPGQDDAQRSAQPAPGVHKQTATLSVQVESGRGAVFVDGRAVGNAPVLVVLAPGAHSVQVRFASGPVRQRRVSVAAGDELRIVLDATSSEPTVNVPPPVDQPQPASVQRTPADIREVVSASRRRAQGCYDRHRDPDRRGVRLAVRATIEADGRVRSAEVTGSGSPALQSCIEQMALAWRFPAGPAPTTISVPFVFTSEDAAATSSQGTGQLTINTVPWARVYVDGRAIGATPILNHRVPAGRHEIRFEAEGLAPSRIAVIVRAGETTRIMRQLGD